MTRGATILALSAVLALAAGPADAGGFILGIGSWLGGIGAAITGSAAFTWLTTNFWGRLVGGLVTSVLQARLARRNAPQQPGIRLREAGTGGLNPRAFGFGIYATMGTKAAPDNSYGAADPNYWLTRVLILSDVPGAQWLRCAIEGEWQTTLPPTGHWGGQTFSGKYQDHAYILLTTGAETWAPGMLISAYGSDPDRRWTADMIGRGLVCAIMNFGYQPSVFNGDPRPRHEVQGIPVYDIRADSTAGGSGAQRWSNRATWTFSENPIVQLYNLMRGVTIDSLGVWGGRIDGADLPYASWATAAAKCDVEYFVPGVGNEPRFRSGLEVKVSDQPHEVASALLEACAAEIADCGGSWRVRVAEPPLPVYFFTDADTLATMPEELDPFPGAQARFNAGRAIYTAPQALYEPVELPLVTNAAWEAEDGEQRVFELPLGAVKSPTQAQRVLQAELRVERRGGRVHRVPLPPDAMILELLDVVSWTSARNGYAGRLFEVREIEDQPETMLIIATLREIDPADHAQQPGDSAPAAAQNPGSTTPPPFALSGVTFAIEVRTDAGSGQRRRVPVLGWPTAELSGKGLEYEVRRVGETALLCSGAVLDATLGTAAIAAEPLAGAQYEARVRLSSIRPQDWSGWVQATVPARRTIGSASLTAVTPNKTVTSALTAFDPVATIAATDSGFAGAEAAFAKLQVSLTGAATASLLWRLVARQTPSGGSYTVFERVEQLTSVRTLVLSAGGSVAAPWAAFDVTVEVSGELLPAGATATITHRSIQFITPDA